MGMGVTSIVLMLIAGCCIGAATPPMYRAGSRWQFWVAMIGMFLAYAAGVAL